MAQGQATKVKKKKKSVLKRAAQSRQRADVNRANRTRVRTMMRRLRTAIDCRRRHRLGQSSPAHDVRHRPGHHQGRAPRKHRQPLQVAAQPRAQRPQSQSREVIKSSVLDFFVARFLILGRASLNSPIFILTAFSTFVFPRFTTTCIHTPDMRRSRAFHLRAISM